MNGLAELVAAPWSLTIDGRDYWLSPLRLTDWGLIEARLVAQRRDPLEVAARALDGLPPEAHRPLVEAALKAAAAPRAASLDEVLAFTASAEGLALVFWLSLRQRQPQIDQAQAAALLDRLGAEELARLAERIDRGNAPAPAPVHHPATPKN